MVAELIEKFTNHLSEKENEKKDIVSPEKALAEVISVV